jgi:thiol-disulfide isomerase/thioredoxin
MKPRILTVLALVAMVAVFGMIITGCGSDNSSEIEEQPAAAVPQPPTPTVAATPAPAPTEAVALELNSKRTKYMDPGVQLAPDLAGITGWHNTAPFTLEDKRGQVVMVKFWTFACYNCVNTMPYVNSWHDKYADDGLVIVGVHYPEFDFERNLDAVIESAKERGIEYPIAQDNNGETWRAYKNRYWPTMYLIDKNGNIRYTHIGEGAYGETERKIQQLLDEPGPT